MKVQARKSMIERLPVVAALMVATLGVSGCRYDGTGTKMQWAPDMADAPTSKPQKSYLDPPPGSVAMGAIFYPKTPEDAEKLINFPEFLAKDPAGEEKGKQLFETFCSVCHGPDAKGGAHVAPAILPPDLTLPVYKDRKDGFFFYRITFGTSVMPGYGHAISAHERWFIVKYLRKLQKG